MRSVHACSYNAICSHNAIYFFTTNMGKKKFLCGNHKKIYLENMERKEILNMGNWGEGYKEGYRNAIMKICTEYPDITIKKFMKNIGKDIDGVPSQYAVANKCCGGVDAHDVSCQR